MISDVQFKNFCRELLDLKRECDTHSIPYPQLKLDKKTFDVLDQAFEHYIDVYCSPPIKLISVPRSRLDNRLLGFEIVITDD